MSLLSVVPIAKKRCSVFQLQRIVDSIIVMDLPEFNDLNNKVVSEFMIAVEVGDSLV